MTDEPLRMDFTIPKLPATTPRVTRSPFVVPPAAYVMKGDLFEDGLRRIIVPETFTDEQEQSLTRHLRSTDPDTLLAKIVQFSHAAKHLVHENRREALAKVEEILGTEVELNEAGAIVLTRDQHEQLRASVDNLVIAPLGITSVWGIPIVILDESVFFCPECRDGKHRNCTGWTLDRGDEVVDCKCPEHAEETGS